MSSHIGKTYLNSCLKVPLDPCNNCPAPFFSRAKTYLGCLSASPNTCKTVASTKHLCSAAHSDKKWSGGDVRSLAKLYDSIPDYADINHLSGEEFYTTLNSLRSTCRDLEIKANCFRPADQCSTSTTSLSTTPPSAHTEGGPSRNKSKKSKKKKITSSLKGHERPQRTDFSQQISNNEKSQNVENIPEVKSCSSTLSKSTKKYLDKEVEILKKSIDEFEGEFKRSSTSLTTAESHPTTTSSFSKEYVKNAAKNKQPMEKPPVRSTFTSKFCESLRKSWSVNDLQASAEPPPELEEFRKQNKILDFLSFKGESNLLKDDKKLSNYFKENSKLKNTEIPKIIVDSSEMEKSWTEQMSKNKCVKNEIYKMPFKLFQLEARKKGRYVQQSTPSPIHPVARPNLAATLRAESSKKKVQELKTNCTFHDTTTQFDWEVRKTPAWKSLSLNETHKQILQLRLATRKAEQALQQREYELNMELMRQRVKSAPLLLEGPTHWGPHVGKLTHSCQRDGRRHLCQRAKRRNNSSRSHSCRRRLFSTTSTLEENSANPVDTFRIQTNSEAEVEHKMNELRKIYGNSTKITKSQSRNSNHSTSTQKSSKSQRRNKSKKEKKFSKAETNLPAVEIDSGEELSSLDRAFL